MLIVFNEADRERVKQNGVSLRSFVSWHYLLPYLNQILNVKQDSEVIVALEVDEVGVSALFERTNDGV